ncbi:MAG: transposase family protein, partial [Chloroflexi bacterium]|nr:transposase family protein [Chloroflexota bacterium]
MSEEDSLAHIQEHFGDIKDPRHERTRHHKLIDILVIAICAIICNADNWEEV